MSVVRHSYITVLKKKIRANSLMVVLALLIFILAGLILLFSLRPERNERAYVLEYLPEVEFVTRSEAVEEVVEVVEEIVEEEEVILPLIEEEEIIIDEERLPYFEYSEYTMEEGETLSSVASLFSLRPETLLSVNSVKNIYSLTEGFTLRIPRFDGQLYTVKAGESLSEIIDKYNPLLSEEEVLALNNIDSIKTGYEIFIPSPSLFLRPVEGRVVTEYGSYIDGIIFDGVMIETEGEQSVVATRDGTVIDKKTENGYVTISILHEDGYQSHYSLLESSPLRITSRVKKGSIVGTSSQEGLVFRITQAGYALNPALFIDF